MSKEGSIARIEKYKRLGNEEFEKEEQDFYDKTYGSPSIEKPKVVKKE